MQQEAETKAAQQKTLIHLDGNAESLIKVASKLVGMTDALHKFLCAAARLAAANAGTVPLSDVCEAMQSNVTAGRQQLSRLGRLGVALNSKRGAWTLSVTSALQHETQADNGDSTERMRAMRATVEVQRKALSRLGLAEIQQLDDSQSVVFARSRPTDIDFSRLVVPCGGQRQPVGNLVVEYRHGRTAAMVAASAPGNVGVMTDDDLRVLYAMFTLTVRYHTTNIPHYIERQQSPANQTPIAVADILDLLGASKKGEHRDMVRAAIERIRLTTWDLHGLAATLIAEDGQSLYLSKSFRWLNGVASASEVAPEVVDGATVVTKPTLYFVEWNEAVFQQILNNRSFWALPPKALTVGSWLFVFYLYLRQHLVKHLSHITRTGYELLRQVAPSADADAWHRMGIRALVARARKQGVSPETMGKQSLLTIDLWGYEVAAVYSASRIVEITAVLHTDQMLIAAGVSSATATGRAGAPTQKNELTSLSDLREAQQALDSDE